MWALLFDFIIGLDEERSILIKLLTPFALWKYWVKNLWVQTKEMGWNTQHKEIQGAQKQRQHYQGG